MRTETEPSLSSVIRSWLRSLEQAVAHADEEAVRDLFSAEHSWWRDVYALGWDITACHGVDEMLELLQLSPDARAIWALELDLRVPPCWQGDVYVEAFFRFCSKAGQGRGVLRLLRAPRTGAWQAWTVSTVGDKLSPLPVPASWRPGSVPVLVVGAGHCGLFLAARLRELGLDPVVVEANQRIGDNWRNRYHGLRLHETKWSCRFPGHDFPMLWPEFPTKDDVGDELERYAGQQGLTVLTGARASTATYQAEQGFWSVGVQRDGLRRTFEARHLVFATGNHGTPNLPAWPGQETFTGQIRHSSAHRGGAELRDRRVLVVGSGSSALDIAQDAVLHGAAEVTLLQRGPTYVVSEDAAVEAFNRIYHPDSGFDLNEADLLTASIPTALNFQLVPGLTRTLAAQDEALLKTLADRGFSTTLGPQDTGMMHATYVRAGGYYLDRGAAALIGEGRISVRSGVIGQIDGDRVVLSDDSELGADLVVSCTGYSSMTEGVRDLLGDEVTDSLPRVWGLDQRGELGTAFRASGHDRLWFCAGGFRDARIYSKPLAMRIATIECGLT